MKYPLRGAVMVLLAVLLSACIGQMPQTPRQSVGAGYLTIESVAELAFMAHRDGYIDQTELTEVKTTLQHCFDLLLGAEAVLAAGGDVSQTTQVVMGLLTQLETQLTRKTTATPEGAV